MLSLESCLGLAAPRRNLSGKVIVKPEKREDGPSRESCSTSDVDTEVLAYRRKQCMFDHLVSMPSVGETAADSVGTVQVEYANTFTTSQICIHS